LHSQAEDLNPQIDVLDSRNENLNPIPDFSFLRIYFPDSIHNYLFLQTHFLNPKTDFLNRQLQDEWSKNDNCVSSVDCWVSRWRNGSICLCPAGRDVPYQIRAAYIAAANKHHLDFGHCLLRLPDANGQPTL